MKILITGGAGFIGSQLGFYLLGKGHDVTLVDSLQYGYVDNIIVKNKLFPRFYCIDIRDPKIEKYISGVDIIFHLAGVSSLPECNYNPYDAYTINTAATANMLELARRKGVKRVIFSSTSAVYENSKVFPLTEEQQVNPTLLYSLSKKHAEDLCRSYQEMYNLDITILRFFNIYGPHMDYLRPNPPFVSYIIKSLLDKKAPILHSDGKQKRDMLFVDDLLRVCEIVMTHPKAKNNTFNVGSGKSYSIEEVFNAINNSFNNTGIKPIYRSAARIWDKYPQLFEGKHPLKAEIIEKEVNKYTLASINKSKEVLNWEAKIDLKEGIAKTVSFAKQDYKKRNESNKK